MDNNTKYNREVQPGIYIDVYDVLSAFKVDNPAVQHAVKKLLAAGVRGQKTKLEDLEEAILSVQKAIRIELTLNQIKDSKIIEESDF